MYATWSEGYRPGGFNRGSACGAKDPVTGINQWCFPTSYDSDDLTNIEAGWKTTFWDGRAQFNGAIYQEKWENAQTGLFAPQLGFPNLQSFLNGPEYEVNGIELNVVVAPIGWPDDHGGRLVQQGRTQELAAGDQQHPGQPDLRRAGDRVVPRLTRPASAPAR